MAGYIRGIGFTVLNPQRKNASIQAMVRGVSFLVTSKVLNLKAVRWNGTQYVAEPGILFDVLLQTATSNTATTATTGLDGTATLNFDAITVLAAPRPASIPAGYQYTESYRTSAKGRNYLTVTLLPVSLPEFPTCYEIL